MLSEQHVLELKNLLSTPKNIVITTHKSPDGDAMGSSLALYNYLSLKDHQINVITQNRYPEFLHWLPGNEKVLIAEENKTRAEELIKSADVIFCLDFNSLRRIEFMGEWVSKSKAVKVMIDHHQQPEDFANYILSTTQTSSTCELIYDFIILMGDQNLLNATIGSCIYTGLITDTGSFRFSSASSKTLRKAARLMDLGVNHCEIHQAIFDTNTFDRLRLIGFTLSNRFKKLDNLKVTYIWLSEQELKQFNYKTGDTEGFVNYGLSISGIKLSAFFVERDGRIKVSFRSKDPFDVNKFARKHFNGGGHKNAAGGQLQTNLQEALDYFINTVNQYANELA